MTSAGAGTHGYGVFGLPIFVDYAKALFGLSSGVLPSVEHLCQVDSVTGIWQAPVRDGRFAFLSIQERNPGASDSEDVLSGINRRGEDLLKQF